MSHNDFVIHFAFVVLQIRLLNRCLLVHFMQIICAFISIIEPSTYVIGGPDMFVDIGSMVNLSCVVSYTEKPPDKVVWLHNEEEISFRGPRSGVSVITNTHYFFLFFYLFLYVKQNILIHLAIFIMSIGYY